jgi:peptide/nickel transport system ATP-binding protein
VEVGDAGQILHAPREEYTRRLVAVRTATARAGAGEPGPEAAPPLLAVESVTARYGAGPPVLADVSLAVHRGETVAVVGESGSGKTSLARVICGLLPCEAGTVRLGGAPLPGRLGARSREQLRRIQMVYRASRARVRARAEELLGLVDLPASFLARRPGELSGGQQQRVSIARALAAEPDLVICDEVTSALDQLVAEETLRLLARLQRETGVAYLFISHDLGTVRRIADRVAVMRAGKVVAQGSQARVFAPPFHPYTELLLSAVPEMRLDWLDDVLRRRGGRPAAADGAA